jgi:hypothetical protein
MIPTPIALGLILCDYVIVEKETENLSFIGSFNTIQSADFPFIPLPFCAIAILTGGQGEATATLTVTELHTDEEVYSLHQNLNFPDRFTELRVLFHVTMCQFDAPGVYVFTLQVDGDWVAHRRIPVSLTEITS